LVFSNIYAIFSDPDVSSQTRNSLTYMGILFGFAVTITIVTIVSNYCFAVAGARLTKKLRVLMFESMLRQEIGFHDLDENRSSILSTKLSLSVNTCKGMTSDKLSLFAQANKIQPKLFLI
jgi:ATP-binding cassette subfamily B (MDR/TAP) protein 1